MSSGISGGAAQLAPTRTITPGWWRAHQRDRRACASGHSGATAATQSLNAWIVAPYLNQLQNAGDAVADVSIFDQPVDSPLSTLAYGKGALGFLAIRDAIGDAAFIEALAAFADAFRLGIAEPRDLLAAFEGASGQELDQLWSFWFESAQTTPADVQTLAAEIAASL
ncbi:MAG: hypothetical protein R2855_07755 [Thermomicrobiales bacterium]